MIEDPKVRQAHLTAKLIDAVYDFKDANPGITPAEIIGVLEVVKVNIILLKH